MARARNIKPGFFKNEDLGTADPFVSLLFAGLWTLADKSGILEDRPLRIKAELFPYRENFDINGYLTVLTQFGNIHRYEVDGVRYIQIASFNKHQNPHHTEKASEFPSYSDSCKVTVKPPLETRSTPADSLIPDSLNTDSLIPFVPADDESSPEQETNNSPTEKQGVMTELQKACLETWHAYATAYAARYGVKPVRNAKVSSQLKQFVKRIGFSESPQVAAFFVGHANAFYIRKSHDVGSLLADAEKLRMEWATGRMVTASGAQQVDRTQSNFNAANEAIRMLEAEGVR